MKKLSTFLFLFCLAFFVACGGADDGHTDHDHAADTEGNMTNDVPLDEGDAHAGHDMDDKDMSGANENLDLSTEKATDNGFYTVSATSQLDPVAINKIHSWIVTIKDAEGNFVEDATLSFDMGMPEHAHGLATSPQVVGHIGGGQYQIDGVKFQMGGDWVIDLTINGSAGIDQTRINLVLAK